MKSLIVSSQNVLVICWLFLHTDICSHNATTPTTVLLIGIVSHDDYNVWLGRVIWSKKMRWAKMKCVLNPVLWPGRRREGQNVVLNHHLLTTSPLICTFVFPPFAHFSYRATCTVQLPNVTTYNPNCLSSSIMYCMHLPFFISNTFCLYSPHPSHTRILHQIAHAHLSHLPSVSVTH